MSPLDARIEPVALAGQRQREAADPLASSWVEASAGSGKTRVLTDRILRLLLAGAVPEALLCLTYTKAAAAEMANRLNTRLAEWATAPREVLAQKLADLTGSAPDAAMLDSARRLLATTLDAPGGMRIGTIHSFAQTLLRRFPLEARVAPHFAMLDEADAADLLREARESVLAMATRDPALGEALDCLARQFAPGSFGDLMASLVATGAPPLTRAEFLARCGLPADASRESLLEVAVARADELALRRAAKALATGSGAEKERGAALVQWLDLPRERRAARWEDWYGLFVTDKGTVSMKLVNKPTESAWPGTRAAMEAEGARLIAAQAEICAADAARITGALATLATPILARFRDAKAARAALDYDDLIKGAQGLLEGEDSPWVLFRLDGGLDHLLIDEAQDTSPAQWSIARALTRDFFAGEGARGDAVRTVFAVGDPKQSIFSFQGAAPQHFTRNGSRFAEEVAAAGRRFAQVGLPVSFRSVDAVLRLVQQVEQGWGQHLAARLGHGGCVELWPMFQKAPAPEGGDEDEAKPADMVAAETLATTIKGWIGTEELPARGRTLRPGDVLVLVRRRKAFLHHLVRALKERGVPVAGADRIRLTESLAVQDCLAFLDALLLPEDDLNLAAVLKGPFCNVSEQDLMDLALPRGPSQSLIAALRTRAGERQSWAAADALIQKYRGRADFVDAHGVLSALLQERDGEGVTLREVLLARLGPEAADPLDELMRVALADSLRHPPSLQGFVHRVRSADTDIKRDADAAFDAVRIMTVHGAKGLQAPVVVLADTVRPTEPPKGIVALDGRPVWLPKKPLRPAVVEQAAAARHAADLEEYARLLYVALTRAEDRLIVLGWPDGNQAPRAESWFSRIEAAFAAMDPESFERPGIGLVRRVGCPQGVAPVADRPRAAAPIAASLPAWATDAAAETPSARRIKPSGEDDQPEPPPAPPPFAEEAAGARRLRRGDLTHQLLQVLPTLPEAARAGAAETLLEQLAADLEPEARHAIAAEALAVMALPQAAGIFAATGLSEAPIVGMVDGRPVNGVIDRLVVTEDRVLLVDFKTDRAPPAAPAQAPPKYLRQLAIYRRLLAPMFHPRRVEAALVWTAAPSVMWVPDTLLDAALPPTILQETA